MLRSPTIPSRFVHFAPVESRPTVERTARLLALVHPAGASPGEAAGQRPGLSVAVRSDPQIRMREVESGRPVAIRRRFDAENAPHGTRPTATSGPGPLPVTTRSTGRAPAHLPERGALCAASADVPGREHSGDLHPGCRSRCRPEDRAPPRSDRLRDGTRNPCAASADSTDAAGPAPGRSGRRRTGGTLPHG